MKKFNMESFYSTQDIIKKELKKTEQRVAEYTFEELKEAYNNPRHMTEEEIKNTFIEDDREIDLSKLKT